VEPLIQALEDEEWEIRYGAAQALMKLMDKRAIEPLTKAQKDPDIRVQRSAREALQKIKSKAQKPKN